MADTGKASEGKVPLPGEPYQQQLAKDNPGDWNPLVDLREVDGGQRGVTRQGTYGVYDAPIDFDNVKIDASHGPILYLENISVSFDGFKALNALNLYIGVGELRCIIGPNGAGKTTLCDVISGKTHVSRGRVEFAGRDITWSSEVDIARRGVGRKFQTPTVFDGLDVLDVSSA